MSFPTRRVAIDVFNDCAHPVQFFITNATLIAEGVSLVGANIVWMESPIVLYAKFIQFIGRPKRYGQKELEIVIRLLFNQDSPIDVKLMHSYRKNAEQKAGIDNAITNPVSLPAAVDNDRETAEQSIIVDA
jgi:hypothetical protein